jgi:peptidoglycan-associated lipoprotein
MRSLVSFLLIAPHSSLRRMTGHFRSCLLLGFAVLCIAIFSGCPNKTPVAQTPPPPPPPAPAATIEATPATVQPGQQVVITWKTENATDVSIDPVGAVQASGSTTVTPSDSTTYHLTAKGPGGVQVADARITVAAPSTQPEATNTTEESLPTGETIRFDIFFDIDEFSIPPNQFATIRNDAAFLKEHPDLRIVVEGHCDELGSTEYNLALGDKRAAEVKLALEKAGVSPSRIRTISYGKEQPFCQEESDACWKMNRRAHIVPDLER